MPRIVSALKIAKYKRARVKDNKTIEAALLEAGYTPKTARHKNSACELAKVGEASILKDILKETTVKSVLEELNEIKGLAKQDKDFSTAARCVELKGKWLAMFTDKQEISQAEKEDNQFSLERLSRIKQGNATN